MTCFGYRDSFPMMNALGCIVTHWTKLMMNNDTNYLVVMIHQTMILYEFSTLRGYWACVEVNMSLWPMSVTLRWSYITYGLGHCWWKLVTIDILNKSTMISLGIELVYPFGWSKWYVIRKTINDYSNFLSGIWYMLFVN